jgi:hypothetical protein
MNKPLRVILLLTLLFTTSTASLSQRRAANKSARKVANTAPQILCAGDAIPRGSVIVGYKSSAKCGDKSQLIIRKPDAADIICSGSPIPDGFHVANQMFSADCVARGAGDSANALSIVSNGFIASESTASGGDDRIAQAFASRSSDIQVEGQGTVNRILPDDLEGGRHQRFIVELASGQTLLVAHNIDLAPRINDLQLGDSVSFNGEYVWNEKGGVIHWTHHDPKRRHVAGWLKHNGKTYQ